MPRVCIVCAVLFLFAITCLADGPAFDAASVTLSTTRAGSQSGGPGTSDPSRFRAPHIRMSALLSCAFVVSVDELPGEN
jgi:hypothetical protein